jgi:hypothetical protein
VKFEIVTRTPGLVGSVARLHYVQDGQPYVMEDRMLEAEPGRRYLSQVSGEALEARVETTFCPSGSGTEMSIRWSGKGRGLLLKLLMPLMRGKMIRGALSELGEFKRLVETRGADFSKPPGNGAGAEKDVGGR